MGRVPVPPFAMTAKRLLSAAAASIALLSAVPAFADDDASSSSSSAGGARVERCARFTRASDYERCARLVRRMPGTEAGSPSSAGSSSSSDNPDAWKWTNIYNRMEAKIDTMVKFASTMGRKFCRDRTAETDETSQECMATLKAEMQVRVARLIDTAFRGDLPSSR